MTKTQKPLSPYHAGHRRRQLAELLIERMGWLDTPDDIDRLTHAALTKEQLADILAALDAAEGTSR